MNRKFITYAIQIGLLWFILYGYKSLFCHLEEIYFNSEIEYGNNSRIGILSGIICNLAWKAGLGYCIAYSLVKLFWAWAYTSEVDSKYKLILYSLLWYCLLFFWTYPYILVSFFQPLTTHTLLHFVLISLFLEWAIMKLHPIEIKAVDQ